ncbi:TPR domain-containing protein [Colletotrichum higginsianum IMI 349063]|uniref:TPR domain-containing protein n=3 Tax=Colletotrichum higginsianum TaxID=80884 RepID=A0A1B7YUJ7_COLHI|nr:TPR domain-containing protein [Colletotrichum higginsianum IMI 349063]OBR15707.1 TPR domain-containing protein [Colletotrichum higginsianum IMI 349063]TID03844.1 SET domain-containing protein 5 [Colletotrichum higginsianum]GJC92020.1 TPR domain-containing protein [Colletotrichum higginsianum]
MFAVRQAAGKGLGVFALKPIPRGRRILAEEALLTVPSSDSGGSLLRQARLLSDAGRASLLALAPNPGKSGVLSWLESLWRSRSAPARTAANHAVLNIFRNNNFDIGDRTRALFPRVARLNHACVPNAQGNFNAALRAFTVHATRDIRADEEITISYLDEHLGLRDARQSALREGYGFACGCAACGGGGSSGGATFGDGEARRAEIGRRLERFAEAGSADPADELEMMTALLGAYDAEGLRGREVSTMCIAAARKAFELGREAEGRELALKGLRLEEDAVGRDSPFYAAAREEVSGLGVEV